MVAGNEPEKLKKAFTDFYSYHDLPRGIALWKWKNSCWICSPENFRQEILARFMKFGVIEFSSAPSSKDIEFMCGDTNSLTVPL
jgi:hypothetical protein